jgi:hypothetical protein
MAIFSSSIILFTEGVKQSLIAVLIFLQNFSTFDDLAIIANSSQPILYTSSHLLFISCVLVSFNKISEKDFKATSHT